MSHSQEMITVVSGLRPGEALQIVILSGSTAQSQPRRGPSEGSPRRRAGEALKNVA